MLGDLTHLQRSQEWAEEVATQAQMIGDPFGDQVGTAFPALADFNLGRLLACWYVALCAEVLAIHLDGCNVQLGLDSQAVYLASRYCEQ